MACDWLARKTHIDNNNITGREHGEKNCNWQSCQKAKMLSVQSRVTQTRPSEGPKDASPEHLSFDLLINEEIKSEAGCWHRVSVWFQPIMSMHTEESWVWMSPSGATLKGCQLYQARPNDRSLMWVWCETSSKAIDRLSLTRLHNETPKMQ